MSARSTAPPSAAPHAPPDAQGGTVASRGEKKRAMKKKKDTCAQNRGMQELLWHEYAGIGDSVASRAMAGLPRQLHRRCRTAATAAHRQCRDAGARALSYARGALNVDSQGRGAQARADCNQGRRGAALRSPQRPLHGTEQLSPQRRPGVANASALASQAGELTGDGGTIHHEGGGLAGEALLLRRGTAGGGRGEGQGHAAHAAAVVGAAPASLDRRRRSTCSPHAAAKPLICQALPTFWSTKPGMYWDRKLACTKGEAEGGRSLRVGGGWGGRPSPDAVEAACAGSPQQRQAMPQLHPSQTRHGVEGAGGVQEVDCGAEREEGSERRERHERPHAQLQAPMCLPWSVPQPFPAAQGLPGSRLRTV